jgi:hemerythrin-like domain-containing protein
MPEGAMSLAFSNRVSQTLHEEHRATVALMERLEQFIARHRRGPPAPDDRGVKELLADLSTAVEAEVQRHFAFEEERLFPYLAAVGDAAIGAHLTDEHAAMRPLGVRIAALARTAAACGFDAGSWEEFRRSGQELCERMLAHAQKEEMALLPLIEDSMDAETEARLVQDYLESA